MALAILELTEGSHGEVLERLTVTTTFEASELVDVALDDAIRRLRLFAQVGSDLSAVSPSAHVQLAHVAFSVLSQLAQCEMSAAPESPASITALWHEGRLQQLHESSLSDSVSVCLRRSDLVCDRVLIELSEASSAGASDLQCNQEPAYSRLRDHLASHLQHPTGHEPARDPTAQAEQTLIETRTPAQAVLIDAAAQRQALASQWLVAAEASSRLGAQPCGDGHGASELRREGKLLGVYVTHPHPSYRYPTWQFSADGKAVEHLAEILTVLRSSGTFQREPEGLRRTTGWGEVEWFMSPHALLGGATPAAVLTDDPARVLRAAQIEFEINDR